MIEKIDARLARLAARHAELSQAIQNASVELAQVEGAHAHLTDLKKEIAEAAEVVGKEADAVTRAPLTRIETAAADAERLFPVEARLQRELARNTEATK